MAKITIPVTLSEKQVKQAAMQALEYTLNGILLQVQLKYNIRIDGLTVAQSNDLRSVQVSWHETASGIRSDEEVQELLHQ